MPQSYFEKLKEIAKQLFDIDALITKLRQKTMPTKSAILYDTAKKALGQHIAPTNLAELGCAVTVNLIYKRAFGHEIAAAPNDTNTSLLYAKLMNSREWEEVTDPQPGDIIISPTGYGNGAIEHGHVAICGKNESPDGSIWIMGNNSPTGTFEVNFTLKAWRRYYQGKGGFIVAFFRCV